MTESNAEMVRRGYEAALRGDLGAIEQLLDPTVKWHGGDSATGCRNRRETLDFMREARKRRPLGELVDVVNAGEKVVVIMRPPAERGEEPALSANVTTFRD